MYFIILLLTIVFILLLNVVLHCSLGDKVRISILHYIASIIGPITMLLLFHSSIFIPRYYFSWCVWEFALVFGYIIGWIEIGLLKSFELLLKSIWGNKIFRPRRLLWWKIFERKSFHGDLALNDNTTSKKNCYGHIHYHMFMLFRELPLFPAPPFL
jgi:hypothetical protein